ncbi:MAG: DUF4249 domain-containing protein [Candidatus Kapabacteria bacterium]|nr:DUF4249 domain-containing protein [Candidatus Kapabacteria bacterium]
MKQVLVRIVTAQKNNLNANVSGTGISACTRFGGICRVFRTDKNVCATKNAQFSSIVLIILSLLLTASFLTSCITTLTEPLDVSFQETLVIRGVVCSGEPVRDIAITKSLNALDNLSDSAVAVWDAQGTLTVNGRSFPLTVQPNRTNPHASLYHALNNGAPIIAESGSTYSLTVQWKGKTASAETSVPAAPDVQTVQTLRREILSLTSATYIPGTQPVTTTRRDTLLGAEVSILPRAETAYRAGVYLTDTQGRILTETFDGGLVFSTTASNASSSLVTGLLPLQTQAFARRMPVRTIVSVVAFDKAYYTYSQTRSRGQQASNLFGGTNGENVLWNVKGAGIGLFIGLAETRRVVIP